MLEQVRGVGDLTDPLNVLIVELQTLEREAAPRGIYGETTSEQAEALAEDGIAIARIPWVPRADG